jgi:hypothetical protein
VMFFWELTTYRISSVFGKALFTSESMYGVLSGQSANILTKER